MLKQRAAAASIGASTILAVVKLAAGFASGSLALLSEGAHNTLDIGASALTLFAVREADKPADADHPFGHAKFEAVAALAETGILAALAIVVAVQAIGRIRGGDAAVDVNAFAIGAILFSIAVDILRWRALTHVARVTSSQALAADALHYSSDLISSVLVLAGLAATRAGYPHADALAAIGVAGFIAVAGFRLGRATIDALVDRAPAGLTEAVRSLVIAADGVAGIEAIRLRPTGPRIVGDVIVSVSRTLPLERVAAIKAGLQARIARRWPEAELTITANPLKLDDETILERVLVIAARRGLPVHHVTIQEIEGRKSVALDLEVDRAMSLGDAHALASELEDAIAEEIGEGRGRNPHRAGRAGGERATGRARSRSPHRGFAGRDGRSARASARHPRCPRPRDVRRSRLCFSTAASIRRRRSKPSTTQSMRSSARCAGRFPRRAGSSAMPSRRATRLDETPSRGSSPSKVAISSRSRLHR